MDALTSDVDGSEDWSWDAIWDSAGRITADGYVVEVAVPLRQLRFPRDSGGSDATQTWGFLAMRDDPRSVRHRLRSIANDRSLNCFVCQFHPLTGFRQIEPGRNLELDPTLTLSHADRRSGFPEGPPGGRRRGGRGRALGELGGDAQRDLRYRRDVGATSTLGVVYTGRDGEGYTVRGRRAARFASC